MVIEQDTLRTTCIHGNFLTLSVQRMLQTFKYQSWLQSFTVPYNGMKNSLRTKVMFNQQAARDVNSLSASLLLNIFLSFEVGIAHAIANFK